MHYEPIAVPLDVKCLEPACNCFREAVLGRLLEGGGFAAPEDEPDCPKCKHANKRHTVVGETKSALEKQRHAKK
jgi:hypothetical protein